ncbi:MAG TPA: methyltransferase domain-containing protein [Ignavibacteriales bacterium]|nr:methyltransferase domain-containing protein [Ignavibacteriales bacterium]
MTASEKYSHDIYDVPSPFLVENIDLLPRGRALDIAMGFGRNSVYLAKMGFTVEGVDISSEAVRQARELARQNSVTIQALEVDLEKDHYIQPENYDVIICFNYLQRSLFPLIKAGLKAGGVIVYETFIIDQARLGHPRNPDYLLHYNELLNLFRDFRCLRYREGLIDGKAIAGLIAEKNKPILY